MAGQLNEAKAGRGGPDKADRPALTATSRLENMPCSGPGSMIHSPERRLTFVKFSDGERLPMLIENSGLPNWFATLFITTQARNASKAPNTLHAMLSAVRSLLAWAEARQMSLEGRFANQQFLGETEIESLRAFAQSSSAATAPAVAELTVISRRLEGARASLRKAHDGVSSNTVYVRLTYMADYLDWLAIRLVEREARCVSAETHMRINTMTHSLRLLRPLKTTPSRLSARKGLSVEAQERLLDIVRQDSTSNPFSPSIRTRNELIVLFFYHLENRAGELLALKTSDFDFQSNEVVFARRHGDPTDPRENQPVLKTLDRRLPLSNSLATAAFNYIVNERDKFPAAKKHAFFVVTHKKGPYEGQPLSMSGLAKIFSTIRRTVPGLQIDLTPHVMRHTTNDNFSELMDRSKVPEAQEEKQRSYLMGWKEGSGTAATYTRRHTEKKAREASLKLQQGWKRGETIEDQ